MSRYWNAEIETMDIEALKKLQGERLKATVETVYQNVPFYAERMKRAGVTPADINGIEDLKKLPFTYKTDLRDNYPFGAFAVPMEQIVRVHASSGTTGKMTVVGYTKHDIETWAECMARCLVSVGVTSKDIVHVAYGYGLFTGGFGIHYGIERVGATVVPVSGGNTKRQVELLRDFKATVLCCTPSYALYIADEMAEMGVKKEDLCLRLGIFGAEPWSEEMRQQIEDRLGLKAYDIYGLSEVMGPGVAINCEERNGLHIQADHFIPEIIDPETEEVLPEGSKGELVFTCITKEALPLIRYRTRDLTVLDWHRCACGRTTPRIQKVTGRSDDMLIIRGVNVFPSQVESVLLKYTEVEPHYLIIVDRKDNLDVMEIQIEVTNGLFSDEVRKLETLERTITNDLASTLGIHAKVRLVEQKTLQRSDGKAKRVIDRRKIFK